MSQLSRRSMLAALAAAGATAAAGAWRSHAAAPTPRTDSYDQGVSAYVPAVRMSQVTPPPPPKGKIMFPLDPRYSCTVLDNFGDCRPLGSCSRRHQGVDILSELGREIFAVVDGVIVKKEIHSTAGLMIDVRQENGTWYSYQHLSRFARGVRIGDTVRRGQVIGYVGDTGNPGAGNYHLHFEWHPAAADGAARNPLPYLDVPDACTVY